MRAASRCAASRTGSSTRSSTRPSDGRAIGPNAQAKRPSRSAAPAVAGASVGRKCCVASRRRFGKPRSARETLPSEKLITAAEKKCLPSQGKPAYRARGKVLTIRREDLLTAAKEKVLTSRGKKCLTFALEDDDRGLRSGARADAGGLGGLLREARGGGVNCCWRLETNSGCPGAGNTRNAWTCGFGGSPDCFLPVFAPASCQVI